MRRNLSIATIITVLVLSIACTKSVVAPVPGSANQFDSDTYLTLVTAKAAIDAAKTALAQNPPVFTPTLAAIVKSAVNNAVTAYNVADTTYQAYHAAAIAGTATAAQQADVSAKISTMNTAVSQITANHGGN